MLVIKSGHANVAFHGGKRLQRIQERQQLHFLHRCQAHLEAVVVEVHDFQQVGGGAVVEIGCAGCEAAQDGAFDAIQVITRVTLRTHDLPKNFDAAFAQIKALSDAAFERLIARFVSFYQESLLNPHWGEQVKLGPGNTLEISMVSQELEHTQLEEVWRPFMEWVSASSQDLKLVRPLFTATLPARDWWSREKNPSMIRDTREGAPGHHVWWQGDQDQVGLFLHGYESLWLPASLLQKDAQPSLVNALFAASRFKRLELHMNKGLAGATPEARAAARQTATNPAMVDAFTLVIVAGGEGPAYPGLSRPSMDLKAAHADARAIDLAVAQLRKIAPLAGSYVSESNYFNPSWQRAYWGDHYARLRAIKKQYDPEGLFFVHHGVGSEEWSPDGFTPV